MVSVLHVRPDKLIEKLKEELKKFEEIKPPTWSYFVKSGRHRQRPPEQEDFWYIRAASILRQLYLHPVGVERLRTYYGGRKDRGRRPAKFYKASGNIIRKILQQLEKAGLAEKCEKGRKLTSKGHALLMKVAKAVASE
jgi:small subunit ribosomal protein S19e